MKWVLLVALGASFLLPAPSRAKKPSARGYIVFDGNPCDDVAATDLDIDLYALPAKKPVEVSWTVLTGCKSTATVTVGVFKAAGNYYPLLTDCSTTTVKDKNTIRCILNDACVATVKTFTYNVCVDGNAVFDPELRFKGTRSGGGACAPLSETDATKGCKLPTKD